MDRGSFSVENVLVLFAWKLLYPDHFFLSRGNHETINMNKVYGFEGEVKHKYGHAFVPPPIPGTIMRAAVAWLLRHCCLRVAGST